jgi:integrase
VQSPGDEQETKEGGETRQIKDAGGQKHNGRVTSAAKHAVIHPWFNPFQEHKTPQSRRAIPIPEGCLVALRWHRAHQAQEKLLLGEAYNDQNLVFCKPDGSPLHPPSFPRHFKAMLRQAGLPPIRLHDARHTFATIVLELGESPKTVQAMLRHSTVAMTLDIDSHVSLELEKRAASRLNAALTGGG